MWNPVKAVKRPVQNATGMAAVAIMLSVLAVLIAAFGSHHAG